MAININKCNRPTEPGTYLCSRYHFGDHWSAELVRIKIDPDDQELMYSGHLTYTTLDRIENNALWWGPIYLDGHMDLMDLTRV